MKCRLCFPAYRVLEFSTQSRVAQRLHVEAQPESESGARRRDSDESTIQLLLALAIVFPITGTCR